MALIKCHECGGDVSTEAAACPKCGAKPRPQNSPSRKKFLGILALLGAVVFATYLVDVYSHTENVASGCASNFKECIDNGDLVNHYKRITSAQYDCKEEVNKHVKYGEPDWQFMTEFGTYNVGDDYAKTGIALLFDSNVKIQNQYGAMEKSKVSCNFDLNSGRVLEIAINGMPTTISEKKLQDDSTEPAPRPADYDPTPPPQTNEPINQPDAHP